MAAAGGLAGAERRGPATGGPGSGGLAGRAERAIASRTVSTLSGDPEAVREERGEVFEEVSVKDAPVR